MSIDKIKIKFHYNEKVWYNKKKSLLIYNEIMNLKMSYTSKFTKIIIFKYKITLLILKILLVLNEK